MTEGCIQHALKMVEDKDGLNFSQISSLEIARASNSIDTALERSLEMKRPLESYLCVQ